MTVLQNLWLFFSESSRRSKPVPVPPGTSPEITWSNFRPRRLLRSPKGPAAVFGRRHSWSRHLGQSPGSGAAAWTRWSMTKARPWPLKCRQPALCRCCTMEKQFFKVMLMAVDCWYFSTFFGRVEWDLLAGWSHPDGVHTHHPQQVAGVRLQPNQPDNRIEGTASRHCFI